MCLSWLATHCGCSLLLRRFEYGPERCQLLVYYFKPKGARPAHRCNRCYQVYELVFLRERRFINRFLLKSFRCRDRHGDLAVQMQSAIDLSAPEASTPVHWMPFKTSYSGAGPVADYFVISPAAGGSAGDHLESCIRGRELKGEEDRKQ